MEHLDLSRFFTTKLQASDFSSRLGVVGEHVYEIGFNLEQSLTEQIGIQKKDRFMNLMRDNNVPLDSTAAIRDFIALIREKIDSLPVLSLTVAFDPNEPILRSISEWFIVNVNKQVVLDIQVDKNLIAGATVSIAGHYFDCSIRGQFEAVLKGTVAHMLEPVAPVPLAGHQSVQHITLGR